MPPGGSQAARLTAWALLCFACTAFALLPARAVAAAPANDDLAAASALTGLPAAASGANADATLEAGEPAHAPVALTAASVWWRWTAPSSGVATIDLCASDYDTVLAVYTGGSVGALTRVASSDDACGLRSRVSFPAVAGTQYALAVAGYAGDMGSIALAIAAPAAPSNDAFASASTLVTASAAGSNVGAGAETGEPSHEGAVGGASVWWRWTPAVAGTARVDTCGSGVRTLLGVYAGASVGELESVVTSAGGCGGEQRGTVATFAVTPGVTYAIAVDGLERETGEIALAASVTPFATPFVAPGAVRPRLGSPVVPPRQPPPGCPGLGLIVLGTQGDDTRSGTSAPDILVGGAGADRLSGLEADDCLYGGDGDDRVAGGAGDDRAFGGLGDDRLTGAAGDDHLDGDAGRDTLTGGGGADRLSGGAAADRIRARDGRRDRIACGTGRDSVIADRRDRVARDCERVARG